MLRLVPIMKPLKRFGEAFFPMWFRADSVLCQSSLVSAERFHLNYVVVLAFSVIIVVCHIVSSERVSVIFLPSVHGRSW